MLQEEKLKLILRYAVYGTTIYQLYNVIKHHGVQDFDKSLAIVIEVLRIINL